MINIKLFPAIVLVLAMNDALAGNVVIIGHANLGKLDAVTVQRIFTGKVIEVDGVPVTAANVKSGPLRDRFLHDFLNQSDEKYTAYWTVRRYIGKGAPPTEFDSAADIIKHVQSTPGAIGYIDEAELKPGVNVLVRK